MIEPRKGYRFFNADCMDIMKDVPDKYFDLAIVDPPYGIGLEKSGRKKEQAKLRGEKIFIDVVPDKVYFTNLFRISKNQIIFGGNYFSKFLFSSSGWIVWDKKPMVPNYSDCELAWTSFDMVIKRIVIPWVGKFRTGIEKGYIRIHPSQKPKALYKWIYEKYCPEGAKVIDTHLGSNSNGIAAYFSKKVVEFWGIEKDKDYYRDGVNRFIKETSDMYNPAEVETI